jgi:hypothetical protein
VLGLPGLIVETDRVECAQAITVHEHIGFG